MKMSKSRAIQATGRALAWTLLFSGFAATFANALALKSIPAGDSGYMLAGYSMFYLVPMFCMIWSFLVFEGWAGLRTGSLNPWPVIVMIYVFVASSLAIYSSVSTVINVRQDLVMLRQHVTGPFPVLRTCLLLAIFGFYVSVLVRQASELPFTASLGRFALCLWLFHFTFTRLLQPIRMIDRVLEQ